MEVNFMKKFLSLILALLMLVSISVPALADIDDPYDLVMADSSIDNLGDDGQMLHGYTYYYKLTNGDETIKIDKRDFKIEYELAKGCDKYVADYGLKDGKFFITVVSSSDATPDDPGYIDFKFSVTAKSRWKITAVPPNRWRSIAPFMRRWPPATPRPPKRRS